VLKIRDEDGCSWEEIHDTLSHRTLGTIQAHYYAIRAGVSEADVSGGQQQKRRRGRPRKQTWGWLWSYRKGMRFLEVLRDPGALLYET